MHPLGPKHLPRRGPRDAANFHEVAPSTLPFAETVPAFSFCDPLCSCCEALPVAARRMISSSRDRAQSFWARPCPWIHHRLGVAPSLSPALSILSPMPRRILLQGNRTRGAFEATCASRELNCSDAQVARSSVG